MNLDQVTVTITPEDGAPLVVNTTDAGAAFLGEVPSAVKTMTLAWQQPNGRTHATPGSLDLELILDTPTHPAIGYEARVDVMIALAGRDPIPIWRGWIDEITVTRRTVHHRDTRRPITTWTWKLAVGDVIARAAATRVNLPPDIPLEAFDSIVGGTTGRIHVIDDAAPVRLVDPAVFLGLFVNMLYSFGPAGQTALRPRDIDNQDVLGLLQTIADGGALQVHDGPNGLVLRYAMPALRRLVWVTVLDAVDNPVVPSVNRPNHMSRGPIAQGPAGNIRGSMITSLPASLIKETPRELNRGTVLNEVAIRYWVRESSSSTTFPITYTDPEERTLYLRNTTRQASTAQHTLDSDICLTHVTGTAEPALDNAQTAAAMSWLELSARPHRTIQTVDLVTNHDELDPEAVEPLIDLADRAVHGLIITDSPDDLDPAWRVLGGHMTIVQGRIDSLKFAVESTRLTGQLPITFDDIPRPVTTQYGDGTPVRVEPTFNYTNTLLRYDSLALVSVANHELYEHVEAPS